MNARLDPEVLALTARIAPADLIGQAEDRFAGQAGTAAMTVGLAEDDFDRFSKAFTAGYIQGWTESQTALLLAVLEAGYSIIKASP